VIRGIIFDYFGVLCHGSLGYLRSIVSSENLQALNDLSRRFDYGHISYEDYIKQVSDLVGDSEENIEKVTRRQYIRNDNVVKLIQSLHEHFKVGMLSNVGRGVVGEIFDQPELDQLFDVVILSNEVGIVKPDIRIYELMATRMGISPEECVMVDDSNVNIKGAIAAGMSGILYVSDRRLKEDLDHLQGDNDA
jgi:HAD superfamily hydrolase (TIGR01509 family)